MPTFLNVLRWIAVLPAFVAAAAIMRWLFDHAFALAFEDVANDLSNSNGFAGHFILGPVYVLALSISSASSSIAVGCWMAPAHRPTVRIVLTALFGFFLLTTLFMALSSDRINYEADGWIRLVLVVLGSGLGTAASYKMVMRGENVTLHTMLEIGED